jgi:hypothetical protein
MLELDRGISDYIYNAAIYSEKRRLTLDGKWQSHPKIYQEYIKFENFFALFG